MLLTIGAAATLGNCREHFGLNRIDNGIMKEPPVRLYIRNGAGYRDQREWPLARAKTCNLYLAPGPLGAVDSLNDGKLSWDAPKSGVEPTSDTYPDSAWSFPGTGSAVAGKTGLFHATRKILIFTGDPVDEDFEVTGPTVFDLWASRGAAETQFLVKIMD